MAVKKKVAPVKTRTLSIITSQFQIVAMNGLGKNYQPPIVKRKNGDYLVRILKGQKVWYKNGNTHTENSWDYFDLDSTGLILKAPRGYSSQFKNVRITDIEQKRIELDESIKKS